MRLSIALRWIARVWSIATILFVAAFMLGGVEHMQLTATEAIGFALFPVGVVLGFVIAWWREGVGGLITICSLALFYIWMHYRQGRFPTGPYFALLSAPGFIYAANALWSKLNRDNISGREG